MLCRLSFSLSTTPRSPIMIKCLPSSHYARSPCSSKHELTLRHFQLSPAIIPLYQLCLDEVSRPHISAVMTPPSTSECISTIIPLKQRIKARYDTRDGVPFFLAFAFVLFFTAVSFLCSHFFLRILPLEKRCDVMNETTRTASNQ